MNGLRARSDIEEPRFLPQTRRNTHFPPLTSHFPLAVLVLRAPEGQARGVEVPTESLVARGPPPPRDHRRLVQPHHQLAGLLSHRLLRHERWMDADLLRPGGVRLLVVRPSVAGNLHL